MKQKPLMNFIYVLLILIYNYFFWNESLGLNLFTFSILLIVLLFVFYRENIRSSKVIITAAGTIISAVSVLVFNSFESKFTHIFSLLLFSAFIHEKQLRSVVFAVMHMISSVIKLPYSTWQNKKERLKKLWGFRIFFRVLRLSIFPFCIALIFYVIYANANPVFGSYAERMSVFIEKKLKYVFENISFSRIFFVVSGAVLIGALIFKNEVSIFLQKDLSYSEKLQRIKSRIRKNVPYSSVTRQPVYDPSTPKFKLNALKNQNRKGVILLLMVNVLLLFENIIDIKCLWLGFSFPEGFSLKHYVHEGTGLLILSILLSVGVLLYYFNRNQNFYRSNTVLKTLAYLWIFQNAILCVSLFLRNYHYIDFHGLAYKRIGVIAFLSLVVFGLWTLYIKIRDLKSPYFLIRINTWALYLLLVILSVINWDVTIARYNLSHWNKGEVDVDFYLSLSGKALPVIYENLNKVNSQIQTHKLNKVKWITYLDYDEFKQDLDYKAVKYLSQYNSRSWLSFNFADNRSVKELSKHKRQFVAQKPNDFYP
jgi:hypothetical protein